MVDGDSHTALRRWAQDVGLDVPDDLLARVACYEDDAIIAARIAARVMILGYFMEEKSTSYANAVETMMQAQRLRDRSYAAVVRWKAL